MRIAIGIAIAGFMGAIARYEAGYLFPQHAGPAAFPWATLIINLTGSLLLGLLTGWLARRKSAPKWLGEVIGTGFIGAYTTFSAFNAQLWQLFEQQAYGAATAYWFASAAGGWMLAAAGLGWGRGRHS
ncbi:fluoride efflux transporter FluC [Cohnella cholangitidis]|uniref:Fluoride-specific ion channel FluC n=1 Tax=Cohnella cholangitidis TaxID=2598458 RepID=A0A7G5BTN4_9BACL|nr:CrcB family protein [Cohnella cholangitidis]QMV40318.1 CrcB family protein [Cohnella cholangitidis]